MLKVDVKVDSITKLEEHIKLVEKLLKLKTDKEFQHYIQQKCLETVKKVATERLFSNPTSNDELKSDYIENNKIKDVTDKGFTIYNDLSIVGTKYNFCVALAFEYGTGLIGEQQAINGAWAYNINNNTVIINGEEIDGWWLAKSKAGNIQTFGESKSGQAIVTRGYEGMEIYRFSAIEIKSMLPKWVNDYLRKVKV